MISDEVVNIVLEVLKAKSFHDLQVTLAKQVLLAIETEHQQLELQEAGPNLLRQYDPNRKAVLEGHMTDLQSALKQLGP